MKKYFSERQVRRYLVPSITIIIFAVLGVIILTVSRAAPPVGPTISKEAESAGAMVGPVEDIDDIDASNRRGVHFGVKPWDGTLEGLPQCDTGRNVGGKIDQFIAAQPDGATITFPADRCYIVDYAIHIEKRRDLTINGNGSTLKRVIPTEVGISYSQVQIHRGSNITIKNLTVEGTAFKANMDVDHEHDANFSIKGTQGVLLENVHGKKARGDFVHIGPDNTVPMGPGDGEGAPHPKNIRVINSTSDIASRNGISCVGCEDVLIDNVDFGDIGYIGFDLELEADFWYGRNITMRNTTWKSYGLKWFNMSGAGLDIQNVTIENNIMTERTTCHPSIAITASTPHSNIIIRNNKLLAYGVGVGVDRTQGLTVTGNRIIVQSGGCGDGRVGVGMTNVSNAVVRDNDFANSHTPFYMIKQTNVVDLLACGNKGLDSDLFDQPKVCPEP